MKLQQSKSPLGITKAWSSGPGFLLRLTFIFIGSKVSGFRCRVSGVRTAGSISFGCCSYDTMTTKVFLAMN